MPRFEGRSAGAEGAACVKTQCRFRFDRINIQRLFPAGKPAVVSVCFPLKSGRQFDPAKNGGTFLRYYRYKNTDKNLQNAFKAQYKALARDEKRIFRRKRCLEKLGFMIVPVVFSSCMAIGAILMKCFPKPDTQLLNFLMIVCKAAAVLILIIASGALALGASLPLWRKAEALHIPTMQKAICSKACGHLRDYYDLQEPYIITKCFDATDRRFRNHDVCIFVAEDELCITGDLVHGFLYGERDLGCYAFEREEILLFRQKDGNRSVTELRTDGAVFMLGDRAKGFIDKHFIAKDG